MKQDSKQHEKHCSTTCWSRSHTAPFNGELVYCVLLAGAKNAPPNKTLELRHA